MDKKKPVGTFLQGRQERERRRAAGGSESNKRGINLPDSWEGQHDFAPVLGILLQRVSLQIHCFQVLRSFQLIQVAPALNKIIVHLQSTYSTPTQTDTPKLGLVRSNLTTPMLLRREGYSYPGAATLYSLHARVRRPCLPDRSPPGISEICFPLSLQASLTTSSFPTLSWVASQMLHPSHSVSSPTSVLGKTQQDPKTVSLYSVPDHTLFM